NCEQFDANFSTTGACGSVAGTGPYWSTTPPTGDLCQAGSTVSSGPTWDESITPPQWRWTCTGAHGGTTTGCGTGNQPINGSCPIPSTFTVTPWNPFPTATACGDGVMPTNITINSQGKQYTFDCPGIWGGGAVHCSVQYEPDAVQGVCGFAQGT